jgi:hypothetical protein
MAFRIFHNGLPLRTIDLISQQPNPRRISLLPHHFLHPRLCNQRVQPILMPQQHNIRPHPRQFLCRPPSLTLLRQHSHSPIRQIPNQPCVIHLHSLLLSVFPRQSGAWGHGFFDVAFEDREAEGGEVEGGIFGEHGEGSSRSSRGSRRVMR